ncbi:cupin domain-containing protein [Marinivivus vitaminiproducens]|uniref:cupin domain-containing protein n=1 Tax=Marinivivus vitaminiproducens TaxID=3035935 RepID=UPI00279B2F3A|nr:cupin domain-containing protein [Geminicoccaceae bacterium SCSIO 64248]
MKERTPNPGEIVQALGMSAHPEGGHFVETYRDSPADGSRGAVTAIYFLLQAGEVSAWHRIDATEIWHYQAGAPLVLTLSPNGHDAASFHLGPDVLRGQKGHVVVPPHAWQTAESLGEWTLVSCTVSPAFAFEGFEMAPPDWRPTPR